MEILSFLLAPFLASLILTGIHAYLGVHVVERGVIFVDLALAQIAALGATIAILVGMDPHGGEAYWLSLAFTFVGAALFTFARTRRGHIPLEAFIGIAYAVASATAILAMSKATGETEHLKDMLVGNILAISMHDVVKTAAAIRCDRGLSLHLPQAIPVDFDQSGGSRSRRPQNSSLGFSVLRIVWFRGDFVGRDCRRLAGVLLPGGSIRRRHVVCRQHRAASGNRLDHGDPGVGAGHLFFRSPRPANRCDDRRHIWSGADRDVLHTPVVFPGNRTQSLRGATSIERPQERM